MSVHDMEEQIKSGEGSELIRREEAEAVNLDGVKHVSFEDINLYILSKRLRISKRDRIAKDIRQHIEDAKENMENFGCRRLLQRMVTDIGKELQDAVTINNKLLDHMITNSECEKTLDDTHSFMRDLKRDVRIVLADTEDHIEARADEALSVANSRISVRTRGSHSAYLSIHRSSKRDTSMNH